MKIVQSAPRIGSWQSSQHTKDAMAKLDGTEPYNMKGLPKVDGPRASPFLAEKDMGCVLSCFYNSFLISSSIFSGVSVGAKRLITLPLRSTRNLVKFHLIALMPSAPGASLVRYL